MSGRQAPCATGRASSSLSGVPPPTDIDRDLADVLRELREAQGRSQETVSHEAGLTVATLARIERRQSNPTWTTVARIAGALGVSLAQLGGAVDQRRTG
jgi:transcriptional regulator with XRE-family HTH domain